MYVGYYLRYTPTPTPDTDTDDNGDDDDNNNDNNVLIFLTSWQAERGFAAAAVFVFFGGEGRILAEKKI